MINDQDSLPQPFVSTCSFGVPLVCPLCCLFKPGGCYQWVLTWLGARRIPPVLLYGYVGECPAAAGASPLLAPAGCMPACRVCCVLGGKSCYLVWLGAGSILPPCVLHFWIWVWVLSSVGSSQSGALSPDAGGMRELGLGSFWFWFWKGQSNLLSPDTGGVSHEKLCSHGCELGGAQQEAVQQVSDRLCAGLLLCIRCSVCQQCGLLSALRWSARVTWCVGVGGAVTPAAPCCIGWCPVNSRTRCRAQQGSAEAVMYGWQHITAVYHVG
jgi:hypothetical protein